MHSALLHKSFLLLSACSLCTQSFHICLCFCLLQKHLNIQCNAMQCGAIKVRVCVQNGLDSILFKNFVGFFSLLCGQTVLRSTLLKFFAGFFSLLCGLAVLVIGPLHPLTARPSPQFTLAGVAVSVTAANHLLRRGLKTIGKLWEQPCPPQGSWLGNLVWSRGLCTCQSEPAGPLPCTLPAEGWGSEFFWGQK